ncbi:1-phosphofructokinase family hexose kinase [Oceanicella actignis]|uniref:Phosphofructokinase n=1 Tax=Oceanicella actignis TaxID=1189325 RepID=A0A1M7TVN2_9RHOB|nr:hexose kinase [Oceanicella actignis]TYO90441.1 6-phosphofructokinase 2 [Oceanicella actignis]SES80434.1 6-phosphofructokinase 2 [Oceanicella actignis]SHN74740.1 6-phosphofructokinase 2 [Oceanicella actignis]
MTRIVTVTLNPALDLSTSTPRVEPGRKLRCAPARMDPGGGGINVSRAIARMGGASVALAAMGGGVGRDLRALLEAEGIETHGLGVRRPTRQSLAVTEEETGAQFRFVLPGPSWSAEDCEAAARRIARAVGAGDLAVLSGSQPPGVPAGFAPDLADRLAAKGARLALDTSGAPLRAAAAHRGAPFELLRMDSVEAAELAGRPVDRPAEAAALAARLVAEGAARMAVVAMGARGSALACADGRWMCAPPPVKVVSAVGAGDSFVAAFVLTLARGGSALEACRMGVAAAAAAVQTPATELCEGDEVLRLAPLVTCEAL